MPTPISQSDMESVFAVTDDLGIHRESVTVQLAKRDPGSVRSAAGNQVQITLPECTPATEWCESVLREELAALGYEELP
jgi:hypothetical protein